MTGDQAKELLQLTLWQALAKEIDGLIGFEEKKFRNCQPEQVKEIQNRIQVFESVKMLPQNIVDREEE